MDSTPFGSSFLSSSSKLTYYYYFIFVGGGVVCVCVGGGGVGDYTYGHDFQCWLLLGTNLTSKSSKYIICHVKSFGLVVSNI